VQCDRNSSHFYTIIFVIDYGRRHYVIYNGYIYSTLTDVPVDGTYWTCQSSDNGGPDYLPLPSGYSIAADTQDSAAVTGAHYWSTGLLVFSNGNIYFTLNGGSVAGSYDDSGYLSQSGSTYNVNGCDVQILITSK
jgi:hypothetical protein